MSAKQDKQPPTQFHSAQECRDEMEKLNKRLDEIDTIMDAKLAASIYRVRADVPKQQPE